MIIVIVHIGIINGHKENERTEFARVIGGLDIISIISNDSAQLKLWETV